MYLFSNQNENICIHKKKELLQSMKENNLFVIRWNKT